MGGYFISVICKCLFFLDAVGYLRKTFEHLSKEVLVPEKDELYIDSRVWRKEKQFSIFQGYWEGSQGPPSLEKEKYKRRSLGGS